MPVQANHEYSDIFASETLTPNRVKKQPINLNNKQKFMHRNQSTRLLKEKQQILLIEEDVKGKARPQPHLPRY